MLAFVLLVARATAHVLDSAAASHDCVMCNQVHDAVGDVPPEPVRVQHLAATFHRLSSAHRVDVTAAHLESARVNLSPKVDTIACAIDSQMVGPLGRDADTLVPEVLLQLPGAAAGSKTLGALYLRDEHANVRHPITSRLPR